MNVIEIEKLWKEYRLGVIGHGTLTHDLQSWWAKIRGKDDPNEKISQLFQGQENQIVGDKFWALQNINIKIEQGEVIGIIGRNGAGKSTLLKILSRVTSPTKGMIKIKGRIASLLEVGTGFHPELTGRENIFMNGSILGMSKKEIKSKFDEIVDFSGVEKFIDTPVKRYSSGMRVRLGFAVAAHLEPEILIVDEVLAVGDASFQNKCIAKMNEVAYEGRTVLFVSHNMASVGSLCSRGLLLSDGLLKDDGIMEDVISNYLKDCNDKQKIDELIARRDRTGSGEVLFERIELLDKNFEIFERNIMTGEEVNLKFLLIANRNVKNVSLSVGFFQRSGTLMTACLSSAIGKSFNLKKGRNEVICSIPRIPLSQGNYFMNVNAKILNVYTDHVKEAGYLTVESGDYYGTGFVPAQSQQCIYIDYDYK